MKHKIKKNIGIFILILINISIIMSLLFFNTQQAAGLKLLQNDNLTDILKESKQIVEYVIIEEDNNESPDNEKNTESGKHTKDIIVEIEENVGEELARLLEQNQDKIDSQDLELGSKILNKLDLNYLLSFDRDNLTEEEKQEIKNYLHQQLTQEEYDQVLQLIGKYIGLVT